MKKISFISFFLLSLIFISFLPILPTIKTLDNEPLLSINKPIIQTTNDFKVIWVLIQEQPYIIDISIQNLKTKKQDINITSVFSDLINIDGLTVIGFYEWKNITYEYKQPIYKIINETLLSNGTVVIEKEIIGYETIVNEVQEWKPSKTRLFTKNDFDYKESYETINIPKLYSKNKVDTFNGTKLFRLVFKTKMEQLNKGWGSKGTIALKINDDVFDPSWLTDWEFRKSHLILNKTGAGENYQMHITAHYSTGSDSGDNVYLNENAQTDFDDIRITDDESNLLYQWLQDKTDSDNAIYWFKVTDNLDNDNTTIYVYYGNEEATLSSDLNNMAYWGGNFETGDFSRWTTSDISWDIQEVPKHGVYSARSTYSASRYLQKTGLGALTKARLISFVRPYYTSSNPFYYYHGSGYTYLLVLKSGYFQYYTPNSYKQLPTTTSYSINNWYFVEIGLDFTTDKQKYWIDDNYKGEVSTLLSGDSITLISHLSGASSAYVRAYVDDSALLKWIDPEPTHDIWGNEESFVYYITFYNQSNSVFMVDGIKINNSSQVDFGNNTVIELQGIINVSTQFIEFSFIVGNAEINPYNYTVLGNSTIWLMVDDVSEYTPPIAVFPLSESILVLNFAIIGIGLCGFWYPLLNWIALFLSLLCLIPMPTDNAFIRNFTVGTVTLNAIMTLLNVIRRLRE